MRVSLVKTLGYALTLSFVSVVTVPSTFAGPTDFPSANLVSVFTRAYLDTFENGVNKYGVKRLRLESSVLELLRNQKRLEQIRELADKRDTVFWNLSANSEVTFRKADGVIEFRYRKDEKVVAAMERANDFQTLSWEGFTSGKEKRSNRTIKKSDLTPEFITNTHRDASLVLAGVKGIKPLHPLPGARKQEFFVHRVQVTQSDLQDAAKSVELEATEVLKSGAMKNHISRRVADRILGVTTNALASAMLGYMFHLNPLVSSLAMVYGMAGDDNVLTTTELAQALGLPAITVYETFRSLFGDLNDTDDFRKGFTTRMTLNALDTLLSNEKIVVNTSNDSNEPNHVEMSLAQVFGRPAEVKYRNDGTIKWFATYKNVSGLEGSVVFYAEPRVKQDGTVVTTFVAYPYVKSWTRPDPALGMSGGRMKALSTILVFAN